MATATLAQRITLGLICPYCERHTSRVDTSEIYGGATTGKFAYLCRRCWAYVGCHPRTIIALGTVADEDTRLWRKAAHEVFDPLWKAKGRGARTRAYAWLARQLGIKPEHTHIGLFNEELCARTVQICLLCEGKAPFK